MIDGIYRFYQLRHDEAGETHRKLVGRLYFHDGQIQHLESHHNSIDEMFPEGPVTPLLERRMVQLKHSGYYQVIHEADIAEGNAPSEVEPMDLGPAEAEHKFVMTGDGIDMPQHVEMWDDVVVVDGRQLDETEAHQLLNEVSSGRVVLTPVD